MTPDEAAKELERVEASLKRKWKEWLRVYKTKAANDGVAVLVSPGSREEAVWEELSALRAQRNNLIEQTRN